MGRDAARPVLPQGDHQEEHPEDRHRQREQDEGRIEEDGGADRHDEAANRKDDGGSEKPPKLAVRKLPPGGKGRVLTIKEVPRPIEQEGRHL